MRYRGFRAGWLIPPCVMLAAVPTHGQEVTLERAMEALRLAEQARAEALTRLEDADRLIAEARQLIAERGGSEASPAGAPPATIAARNLTDAQPKEVENSAQWRVALDTIAAPASQATRLERDDAINRVAQRADPVFGFSSGKEGDYGKLGARLNWRFAQGDGRDRPHSRSLELAGRVRIDKNRGAELRRFTPDGNSWASDLAIRADYRLGWYKDIYAGET